jgi:hypothetical protein
MTRKQRKHQKKEQKRLMKEATYRRLMNKAKQVAREELGIEN